MKLRRIEIENPRFIGLDSLCQGYTFFSQHIGIVESETSQEGIEDRVGLPCYDIF